MVRREDIVLAIDAYNACLRSNAASEREADDLLEAAIRTAPHARLADLIFYGERERTTEEVAEEAFQRERLWQSEGELAVLLRVYEQMKCVADDPNAQEIDRYHASQGLLDISTEIDKFRGKPHTN